MKPLFRLFILFFMVIVPIVAPEIVSAQVKNPPPQIGFNSFSGTYYLSRDSKGLSLLTTEETILADFPSGGSFYGITRTLPKKFQNHSVNTKILGVSDAAGNIIPYKTVADNNGDLVITTGDPSITLYGSQTIKIRYQTSGVINLNNKNDEFLLNVNGRGWNQQFNSVSATLHIPASFNSSLKSKPSCYVVLGQSSGNNCTMNTQKSAQETVVTSAVKNVAAHQALVLKLEFASSTFTNKRSLPTIALGAISALLIILGSWSILAYNKRKA
jgi:hypothetical protein